MKKIDNINLNFESDVVRFFSENFTPINQYLGWKCHKQKCAGKIHSSSKAVDKLMSKKLISVWHGDQIADLYPNFVFKQRQSRNRDR